VAFFQQKKRIYICICFFLFLVITSTIFLYTKYYYKSLPVKKRIPFVKMDLPQIEAEFLNFRSNYEAWQKIEICIEIIVGTMRRKEVGDYKEAVDGIYILGKSFLSKKPPLEDIDFKGYLEQLKTYKLQLQNLIMHLNINNKKNLPDINRIKKSIENYINELNEIIIFIELFIDLQILKKILKTTYAIIQIKDLENYHQDLNSLSIYMEENLILWQKLLQKIYTISFKNRKYTIKIKDLLPEVLLDLWEEDFSIARGIGEKKMAGTFKLGDVAEVFGLFILVTPENIEYCNTPININNYSTWIEKTIKDIKKILEEKASTIKKTIEDNSSLAEGS